MLARTVFHGKQREMLEHDAAVGPGPATGLPSTRIVPVSIGRKPPIR